MKRSAVVFPISLGVKPASGTGIQHIKGRMQPYVTWFGHMIEGFDATLNSAYIRLQRALDNETKSE